MTSGFATNSIEEGMERMTRVKSQKIDKITGVPVEGQTCKSYGPAVAGAVNSQLEIQIVPGGTALTIDNTLANTSPNFAKNLIGRRIVFKCNVPAAATTLTLTGANYNSGTTTIATFSSSVESAIELAFTDNAGALVISVISLRAVVLS